MLGKSNVLKIGIAVSALVAAVSANAGRIYTNIGFDLGGVQVSVPISVPVPTPVVVTTAPQVYYAQPVPVQQQVVTTYQNGYQTQTVIQTTTTYAQPVQQVYGQTVYVQPARPVFNGGCYRNQWNCGYNVGYNGRQNYHHRDNDRRDDYGYDRYSHVDYNQQAARQNYQRSGSTTYIPIAVPSSQRTVIQPANQPQMQQPNPQPQPSHQQPNRPNTRSVGYNVSM